jgi:hypothetical protein
MEPAILNELQRSLGRIEGKQDALLLNQERLREDYDKVKQDVSDLRNRINWYSGSIAAFGTVFVLFKDRIYQILSG